MDNLKSLADNFSQLSAGLSDIGKAAEKATEGLYGTLEATVLVAGAITRMTGAVSSIKDSLEGFFKPKEDNLINSFSESVTKHADSIGQKMSNIGKKGFELQDTFDKFCTNSSKKFGELKGKIIDSANQAESKFGELKETISTFSFSSLKEQVQSLPSTLSDAFGEMGENLSKNSEQIGTMAGKLLTGGLIAGIALAAAGIIALIESFQYLMESNEEFREKVETAWAKVTEAFAPAIEAAGRFKEALFGEGSGEMSAFAESVLAGTLAIIDLVTQAASVVSEVISGVLNALTELWNAHGEGISAYIRKMIKAMTKTIRGIIGVVSGVIDVIAGFFRGDKNKITAGVKKMSKGIQNIFSGMWSSIKTTFSAAGSFFRVLVDNIKNRFLNLGKSIGKGLSDAFKSVVNYAIGAIETKLNGLIGMINGIIHGLNQIPGVKIGMIGTLSIPRLAGGGLVDTGQVFVAREAGPELVGSFRGRTAVMNNNQIVDSVSRGVYQAVREAMGGEGGSYTFNIVNKLDGKEIGRQVVNYHNSVVKQTGMSPLMI